jgi:prepilin-type processing-associated H-X9-DG protein
MKIRLSQNHSAAMSLFEVGVVIAVVMILAVLFLPRLLAPKHHGSYINCINNLKQDALAFRIWAGDNGDKYPMQVSVPLGGAREMVATGNVTQVFQVMSNELSTPKILLCPEDLTRRWATNFAGLSNSNISYFVGVDVTNELNPNLILSGDSHFELKGFPVKPGLCSFWTNDPVAWTRDRHGGPKYFGNLAFADGSVQTVYSANLRHFFEATGLATNRLALP